MVTAAGRSKRRWLLKRLLDVVIAAVAIVILSPLVLIVAILVAVTMGTPLMFSQRRLGLSDEEFTLHKFRTMREAYDEKGSPLPDEERMTAAGVALRRTRLDELPGFVAVLAGHMSLVGPRPLPAYIVENLSGAKDRTMVRPGFTGLAQVSGNTKLTNREKIALDLYYIRHSTMLMDLQILLKTIVTVIAGEKRDEELIAAALGEASTESSAGLNPAT